MPRSGFAQAAGDRSPRGPASRTGASNGRLSLPDARCALAARLRDRLPELDAAVATRVYAISEPRETADPEYLQGLRGSLRVALDYALTTIELGEQRAPAIPASLLAQARLAARNAVSLDTVLRRYFAGYGLLGELIYAEAEQSGIIGGPVGVDITTGPTVDA